MSEKVTVKVERHELHLPAIALRGLVVFPNNLVHFEVGRAKSIAAVEWAMANNSNVFLVTQKEMGTDEPAAEDLYAYGVVAEVKQVLRVSDELVKVLVEGKTRAKMLGLDGSGSFLLASVRPAPVRGVKADDSIRLEALLRSLKSCFDEYLGMNPRLGKDVVFSIVSSDDPVFLSEYIPANLLFRYEDKQAVMNENTLTGRLQRLIEMLRRECQVMRVEKEIADKVNEAMDRNQREYYLHEQLHVINDELGEGDDTHAEADEYRRRIQELHLAEDSEKKLLKEVDRLAKMQGSNQEAAIIRTYLDTCLDLPWNTFTVDDLDIARAQQILDRDHYGLKKVKDRILEILAVRKLSPDVKAQIICLAGPPGVGKTSIALSVAKALNRKLSRISLGGVRDEADIRGHRKTYIGAMPGRIVEAISRSGAMNPLLVLDEIDKLSGDYRGDPASALLEALDSEQNHAFRDHFLEIPLDLSQVMFITTANSLDTIPRPLLDRMEVIQLSSYTDEEKLQIAKNHLLPKQMKEHGLKKGSLRIDEETLRAIIRDYTRESGVRQLERRLAAVCRKTDMQLLSKTVKRVTVTEKDLPKLLDMQPYPPTVHVEQEEIGVVNGLAWTEAGGEILEVEVNVMDGSGKLELTGNLGDVMKESAQAALSCLRSRAETLGIDPDFYKTKDIHVHFPEGAVPKDGPSAGIAMATALLSALTNRKIKAGIAMTGEVTLRGRVLPIGGLKEKTMAAKRYGIHTVLIPKDNARDLEEIDQTVRAALRFVPVETVDQVFAEVFCPSRVETKADAIPAFLPVENSKEAALRQ